VRLMWGVGLGEGQEADSAVVSYCVWDRHGDSYCTVTGWASIRRVRVGWEAQTRDVDGLVMRRDWVGGGRRYTPRYHLRELVSAHCERAEVWVEDTVGLCMARKSFSCVS